MERVFLGFLHSGLDACFSVLGYLDFALGEYLSPNYITSCCEFIPQFGICIVHLHPQGFTIKEISCVMKGLRKSLPYLRIL